MKKLFFIVIFITIILCGCDNEIENTSSIGTTSDISLQSSSSSLNTYNTNELNHPSISDLITIKVLDVYGQPLSNAFVGLGDGISERTNCDGIVQMQVLSSGTHLVYVKQFHPDGTEDSENISLDYRPHIKQYELKSTLKSVQPKYEQFTPRIEIMVFYKDKTPVKNVFVDCYFKGETYPQILNEIEVDEINFELRRGYTNVDGIVYLPLDYQKECSIDVRLGDRHSDSVTFHKEVNYIDGVSRIEVVIDR